MYPVSKHDARIATLAYADVFHSSLTRQELALWFLFYPVASAGIPKNRPRQEDKWKIAERASRWLSLIPTIQLVGVTGGLAMNNAKTDDDIDLFFVVAGGTLWVSRMLATILMDILGLRRRPKDTIVANKVCLNMFMTARSMGLSRTDQDCFTAHEVLQMHPLFIRGDTYKRFLRSNTWVKTYLPNAWRWRVNSKWKIEKRNINKTIFFTVFEPLVKSIQVWYMRKKRTNEVITDTTLRFHPKDARIWVKRKLAARLAKAHIPLDKIFYAR